MNRRDIIIIAVLVNAGLLALIFMLATNSDDDRISESTELTAGIELPLNQEATEPMIAAETASVSEKPAPDSVDQALKECLDANSAQPVVIDDDSDMDEEPAQTEEPATAPVSQPKQSSETAVPSSTKQKIVEITVKRGDSLDKIAKANGTTIKAIKDASDLKSDRLNIGQVLRVPIGSKKPKETQAATTPKKTTPEKALVAANDPQYYTIKSGDNPWKIAKQFNIKVDDFLKLNSLNEDKARNLKVGDKVRIK